MKEVQKTPTNSELEDKVAEIKKQIEISETLITESTDPEKKVITVEEINKVKLDVFQLEKIYKRKTTVVSINCQNTSSYSRFLSQSKYIYIPYTILTKKIWAI